MRILGRNFPGRQHSRCKGPEAGACMSEKQGTPCGWSRVNQGRVHIVQGLAGLVGALAVTLCGGKPWEGFE